MNYSEFVTLVRRMRAAQKRYFRHRLQADLDEAKILERVVDALLKDGPVLAREVRRWEEAVDEVLLFRGG